MKLIIAIVQDEDAARLVSNLMNEGYSVTKLATTGGFLRVGNTTIFCGVKDEQVDEVLTIIREGSPSRVQYVTPLPPVMEPGEVHIPTPIEKHVGGATVFVLNVEHFEKV